MRREEKSVLHILELAMYSNIIIDPVRPITELRNKARFHLFRTELQKHCNNRQQYLHFTCSVKIQQGNQNHRVWNIPCTLILQSTKGEKKSSLFVIDLPTWVPVSSSFNMTFFRYVKSTPSLFCDLSMLRSSAFNIASWAHYIKIFPSSSKINSLQNNK